MAEARNGKHNAFTARQSQQAAERVAKGHQLQEQMKNADGPGDPECRSSPASTNGVARVVPMTIGVPTGEDPIKGVPGGSRMHF